MQYHNPKQRIINSPLNVDVIMRFDELLVQKRYGPAQSHIVWEEAMMGWSVKLTTQIHIAPK
jgi:hypothetical protein